MLHIGDSVSVEPILKFCRCLHEINVLQILDQLGCRNFGILQAYSSIMVLIESHPKFLGKFEEASIKSEDLLREIIEAWLDHSHVRNERGDVNLTEWKELCCIRMQLRIDLLPISAGNLKFFFKLDILIDLLVNGIAFDPVDALVTIVTADV